MQLIKIPSREAWKALEDAYKAGKLKSIGLSNFQIGDIESILEVCEIKPMVNQREILKYQKKIWKYLRVLDI